MTLIKSISGIRGTIGGAVGSNLTPIDAVNFASAFGAWIKNRSDNHKIVIGRDARLSGKMISDLVCASLIGSGIDVIDLGLSTTPTVEIAVIEEHAAGGIIITASHNPIQWNALKLLNETGEFISGTDGEEILRIVETSEYSFSEVTQLGTYIYKVDYLKIHIEKILALDLVDVQAIKERNFKVVVDGVNSSGGIAVPALLEGLGVHQITKLFCEPTGNFIHNPEPIPENLSIISNEIKNGTYDLGIVVDPDVDRLCFLCEDGSFFGEEYTLVSIAKYVLDNKKGSTVSNLSSTRALRDVTEQAGCAYYSSAVGEVNVVTKMKEVNAVIGGEGNGGIIYPELHYGRDALVGIALFLTHLAKLGKSVSALKATLPFYYLSKNKIELTPNVNIKGLFEFIKNKYKTQPISTVDGVKIEFGKEWVHLRSSNTEPIIRIYSEAPNQTQADALVYKIMDDIKEALKI